MIGDLIFFFFPFSKDVQFILLGKWLRHLIDHSFREMACSEAEIGSVM